MNSWERVHGTQTRSIICPLLPRPQHDCLLLQSSQQGDSPETLSNNFPLELSLINSSGGKILAHISWLGAARRNAYWLVYAEQCEARTTRHPLRNTAAVTLPMEATKCCNQG